MQVRSGEKKKNPLTDVPLFFLFRADPCLFGLVLLALCVVCVCVCVWKEGKGIGGYGGVVRTLVWPPCEKNAVWTCKPCHLFLDKLSLVHICASSMAWFWCGWVAQKSGGWRVPFPFFPPAASNASNVFRLPCLLASPARLPFPTPSTQPTNTPPTSTSTSTSTSKRYPQARRRGSPLSSSSPTDPPTHPPQSL